MVIFYKNKGFHKVNMIEIDHKLIDADTLENLLIDIITRQATDYGEHEVSIQIKINELKRKLASGDVVIVYNSKEESCDIIRTEDFKTFQNISSTKRNTETE